VSQLPTVSSRLSVYLDKATTSGSPGSEFSYYAPLVGLALPFKPPDVIFVPTTCRMHVLRRVVSTSQNSALQPVSAACAWAHLFSMPPYDAACKSCGTDTTSASSSRMRATTCHSSFGRLLNSHARRR
jgi:hypothetical protein